MHCQSARPVQVALLHPSTADQTCRHRLSAAAATHWGQRPAKRRERAHLLRRMSVQAAAVASELDVAIIGGGPGGLAAAHAVAAAAPHLKVAVLERVPQLIRRGAGFSLAANGQKALQAISPGLYSAAEAMGVRLTGGRQYSSDGTLIRESSSPLNADETKAHFGYSSFMVAWSDLQQLLAQELPSNVPLHLGQRMERYEELPDGSLLLHLAGQEPVRTQLLVGADGYFSRVRQQCLGDGPPTFNDRAMWRGRIKEECAVACGVSAGTSAMYQGDFRVAMCFPISGGEVVWTAFAPDEQLKEAGIDFLAQQQQRLELSQQAGEGVQDAEQKGRAAKERCLKVFDKYPEAIKSMMRNTLDSAVVEHGLYTRAGEDVTPDWFGRGRVVLIGDAAHPMRPTGQGLNQAMEDAYHLGRALAEAGGIHTPALDSTLEAFRASRAERVAPVMIYAHNSATAAYRKDGAAPASSAQQRAAPVIADYDSVVYGIDLSPLSDLACST